MPLRLQLKYCQPSESFFIIFSCLRASELQRALSLINVEMKHQQYLKGLEPKFLKIKFKNFYSNESILQLSIISAGILISLTTKSAQQSIKYTVSILHDHYSRHLKHKTILANAFFLVLFFQCVQTTCKAPFMKFYECHKLVFILRDGHMHLPSTRASTKHECMGNIPERYFPSAKEEFSNS